MSEPVSVSSRIRWQGPVVALALLLAGGLAGWLVPAASGEADRGQADLSRGASGRGTAGGSIVARGRIEPAGRVLAIHGPAEGAVIQELMVGQGDKVAAGQILARLDGYDIRQAELVVAERTVALAGLQHSQVVAGAKKSDLAAQRNALAARQAQLARLKVEWERRTSLFHRQVVSQQSLDALRAELTQAENEVSQAANVLRSLSETRGVDDEVATARIAIEQASLTLARARLDHMLVRAPVAGTILSVQARAGEAIGQDGLLRMADLDDLLVVAEVDEAGASGVRPGMAASIEGPLPGSLVRGTVVRIAPEVFRQKRPSSDVLLGRDARIVEVEIRPDPPSSSSSSSSSFSSSPGQTLPALPGAEVLVRLGDAIGTAEAAGHGGSR